MPRQPADAAKKPKFVGNSEIANNDLPLAPLLTPSNKPEAWVKTTPKYYDYAAPYDVCKTIQNSTSIFT
jgi:hypothetical protein